MLFIHFKKIALGLFVAVVLLYGSNLIGNILVKIPNTQEAIKREQTKIHDDPQKNVSLKEGKEAATASTESGKKLFKKCRTCHAYKENGRKKIGPNLWEIFGRPIGNETGFKYSPAMRSLSGTWNYDSLDLFLADPKKFLPGTKMSFSGIKNKTSRKNLILYLKSLQKS